MFQAQYNYGVCLVNGTGTLKDPKEAVKWFGRAADSGEINAIKNIKRLKN